MALSPNDVIQAMTRQLALLTPPNHIPPSSGTAEPTKRGIEVQGQVVVPMAQIQQFAAAAIATLPPGSVTIPTITELETTAKNLRAHPPAS